MTTGMILRLLTFKVDLRHKDDDEPDWDPVRIIATRLPFEDALRCIAGYKEQFWEVACHDNYVAFT